MFYRSMNDLNQAIVAWTRVLPRSLDLIVGIPRSGLLVANMIALYMHRPVGDVEGLLSGRQFDSGPRLDRPAAEGRPLDILVVDDSLWSGAQMAEARRRIEAAGLPHRIRYGAVYIAPGSADMVDFHHEVVPVPRLFEWNLMHHPFIEEGCLDIGVLLGTQGTPAPTIEPKALAKVLSNTVPAFRTDRRIGWLIADMPAACRPLLESWLVRHDVAYRTLVLRGEPPETGARHSSCAAFMTHMYERTGAWVFIVGRPSLAARVARRALRPVFCHDQNRMFFPGDATHGRLSVYTPLRWLWTLAFAARGSLSTAVRSIGIFGKSRPLGHQQDHEQPPAAQQRQGANQVISGEDADGRVPIRREDAHRERESV
jgi:orotate phosphoribosyltransferase